MKKILVPTDFSKSAQIAADVAGDIALKSGAELILLHVVEAASEGSFNVEGESGLGDMENSLFTLKLIERAKNQLAKMVENLSTKGIKVKQSLKVGTPFHGMRTLITERKVDLVVMGTSGKSDIEEMIIGSNTEKVVR